MENRLLGLALTLALANVVPVVAAAKTPDGNINVSFSSTLLCDKDCSHPLTRGLADNPPSNMTYRPLDDLDVDGLDPGGEGEGRGPAFEVNVTAHGAGQWWMGECQSNESTRWGITWPVCSTRYTSLVVLVVVTVVLSVITLWTIIGNVLVLVALYRYRVLRTMSNCLIGNLAVSDLLLAITVLPVSTANDVLGYWVFGRTMCTLWLCIDVLYCTASIWGLCTIAFDRYTATVYPMWYHDKRSPKKALAYMIFVWLFSIVISLAPFIGWQDMIPKFYILDEGINRHLCILFSSQSYVIYSAVGSFILPLCLMSFLYVQIFVVLHQQADHLHKSYRRSRVVSGGAEISSRLDTECPTFVLQDSHSRQRVLSRDFTASSFMPETGDREREEEKEGNDRGKGEEGEGKVGEGKGGGGRERIEEDNKGSLLSPTRTRLDFNHKGQTGQTRMTRFDRNDTRQAGQGPVKHFHLDKLGQTGQGHASPSNSPDEGAGKDNDVTVLPSRPRFDLDSTGQQPHQSQATSFDLDDTGQTGQDQASSPRSPSPEEEEEEEEEASKDPLLEQRSDSLDTVLDPCSPPVTPVLFPVPQKNDLLTANTCAADGSYSSNSRAVLTAGPLRFSRMRKSRSAAFRFEDNNHSHSPAHDERRSISFYPPPRMPPPGRCHSVGAFCRSGSGVPLGELENGHSGKSLCSLQLQRSPSAASKSYALNVSMRRRFQLREQRATKRMLLIMACFFVCWIPFTLMYMLRSLCPHCPVLDDHLVAFIIWLGYVNSSLNPLLYTLFNDDFRKAFKKLLGLYRPRRFSATTATE